MKKDVAEADRLCHLKNRRHLKRVNSRCNCNHQRFLIPFLSFAAAAVQLMTMAAISEHHVIIPLVFSKHWPRCYQMDQAHYTAPCVCLLAVCLQDGCC